MQRIADALADESTAACVRRNVLSPVVWGAVVICRLPDLPSVKPISNSGSVDWWLPSMVRRSYRASAGVTGPMPKRWALRLLKLYWRKGQMPDLPDKRRVTMPQPLTGPLVGQHILVTRPAGQAASLIAGIERWVGVQPASVLSDQSGC